MPKTPQQNQQKNSTPIDDKFYENVIVYNAITNEDYLTAIIDVVKPSFFKNEDVRTVIDIICKYYRKRSTVPTVTELKAHLVTEEQRAAFKNIVLNFKQLDTVYNFEELIENTEHFFKERAIYNAVVQTATDCSKNTNKLDSGSTLQLFEEACNISLVDNLGLDYFNEINKHCDKLLETEERIPTGYKWLDKKLGGGLLKDGRAMYTFSGVTNSGKSIILGNIGTNILSLNKNVVIISLEMSENVYAQRIDGQLTRIPLKELKNEIDNLKTVVNNYRKEHGCNLYIKEYPPKGVTVNHIKAYIQKLQLKKKIKIDVIIVDYVNLIQPTVVTGNSYTDVKLVAEQLRALSYIFNCPVITATQNNRSAFDQANPGLETTSESMGLSMTTDFQASIWSDDADKELGILHMGIQKSRFGENFGTHAFRIDYNTLAIDETDDDFTESNEVADAENTIDKLLK